jgi:hypothetical protein
MPKTMNQGLTPAVARTGVTGNRRWVLRNEWFLSGPFFVDVEQRLMIKQRKSEVDYLVEKSCWYFGTVAPGWLN